MRITTKSRYAIRAIYALQRLGGEHNYVSIIKILETEKNISKKYLEQIFTLLKNAKIISALRGASGGYKLSRPPEKITVKEIIDVMDGQIVDDCCDNSLLCSSKDICSVNSLWGGLKNVCDSYLENITVKQLVENSEL